MEDSLRIELTGDLATLTLQRPERCNALDAASVERFLAFLDGPTMGSIGCMVIRGSGPNFCAGLDLTDSANLSDGDLLWRLVRIETLLQRLFHAPFPVIAFAHGSAIGAGADLFCACMIRYMRHLTRASVFRAGVLGLR